MVNMAEIRRNIKQNFTDAEFVDFCSDHFPEVYQRFSSGMQKGSKITLLLDYCRRLGKWQYLADSLQIESQARRGTRVSVSTPQLSNSQDIDIELLKARMIRQFDDVTYSAFCLDYFPDVFEQFSGGMRKDYKVELLLNYCVEKGLLKYLARLLT